MASIVNYANVVGQIDTIGEVSFNNIANLKNGSDSSLATTGTINGRNTLPNQPCPLTFTKFNFDLPVGAEVISVTVAYRHKKGGSCSIGSPIITLLGVNGFSATGVAPSKTSLTTSTKLFTGSGLTRTAVNSDGFGVKIEYPSNSGTGSGTISLAYVNITVEYKLPSYTVNVKKVSGGYNNEKYTIECSISNVNLTSYNPTCTLTAPSGFSFDSAQGSGDYNKVDNRTITWDPKLTNKIGTSSINMIFDVNVLYPIGETEFTGTFTLVESLYSTTNTFTATITERPQESSEEDDSTSPVIDDDTINSLKFIKAIAGEEIPVVNDYFIGKRLVVFAFRIDENNQIIENCTDVKAKTGGDEYEWQFMTGTFGVASLCSIPLYPYISFKFSNQQRVIFIIYEEGASREDFYYYEDYSDSPVLAQLYFEVKPNEEQLSQPNYTILALSEEETNRLGDGYTYICQADMKHSTTDTFTRDWYKNNRIGVFNGVISNDPSEEDIFENTTNWSKATAGLNEYGNVEVEFTYDAEYPLYIIMAGDYQEAYLFGYDMGTLLFDNPSIIEKQIYNSREPTGTYPIPILNLLTNEDSATLTLESNETSTSVVLYDLPLEESFGTNEDYAIRGIQVRANIQFTDNLVIYAKLHSPNGEIGQRSSILKGDETELIIGGLGDLWGFTTLQLTNLHLWELELSASNILLNTESTIVANSVSITFYLETVEKQDIKVIVEGEDLAYYGAFIEAVNIPEGLETDTSFLTIDGTDTNDAYRQNIREKHITISFNLNNCDIQTSTNMLRQLTKLFTNEKDQYNRPIPKRLQFSHYPTDYFEYIMEEPFDVETELTDYNVKANLTIPSGTSYSLEDTVTNTVGNANGLAAINPIIHIRPSDSNIQIKEGLTEQSFQMGYSGDWSDYIVEIDCDDRRAYLIKDEDTKVDISKYVDHNSDWFRLSGEFEFEGINCTILTVTFNERW